MFSIIIFVVFVGHFTVENAPQTVMPNIHLLYLGTRKFCMPYRENTYENMYMCVCLYMPIPL